MLPSTYLRKPVLHSEASPIGVPIKEKLSIASSLQPNTCNQMATLSLVYNCNALVGFYFCNNMAYIYI